MSTTYLNLTQRVEAIDAVALLWRQIFKTLDSDGGMVKVPRFLFSTGANLLCYAT
ncbi:MAG: hypothetical protein ACFB0C_18155 [Leptolyngbyaceae cyanobacterium]